MCRDTIRAGLRNITACSAPSCASSSGSTHLTATIGRPESIAESEIASWTIETKADDWQTRTTYDFLRFEDFIQRDLALPIWRIVFQAVWIYWRLVFRGTVLRFLKANWRFATFITYPHHAAAGSRPSAAPRSRFGVGMGLERARHPRARSASLRRPSFFVALLGTVLKYTENRTYLLYLMCDTIWTWQFSHRQRPEWDQRIDRFAQYLCKVRATSEAEEIVLVGHSSGSFLGTEILARALKLDPALGRHGPRIVLLTHRRQLSDRRIPQGGAGFPRSSAPARGRAVDRLDRLPGAQGRDEFLPVRSDRKPRHRRGPARRNPTIVPVRFREIILPENYNAVPLAVLPRPFPVRDGERRCRTPTILHDRVRPGSTARAHRGSRRPRLRSQPAMPTAREKAWKETRNGPIRPPDAAELGDREPTARRRRLSLSALAQPMASSARRVGFGGRFGVKVAALWALEGGLSPLFDGAKRFRKLEKVAWTGKSHKGDDITLTDPERI